VSRIIKALEATLEEIERGDPPIEGDWGWHPLDKIQRSIILHKAEKAALLHFEKTRTLVTFDDKAFLAKCIYEAVQQDLALRDEFGKYKKTDKPTRPA
jgi:hypothetical protein